MKKTAIVLLFFVSLLLVPTEAATLYRIRFSYYPEKIRAVFDFDGPFTYQTQEAENKITLFLKETKAGYQINNYVEVNDLVIKYFEVEQADNGLKVTIPLQEAVKYAVFHLNSPPRLVIDFSRNFVNILSGGMLENGIEFLKIKKGSGTGNLFATVLKADLNKATITPTLAQKYKPNLLESLVDFINPWKKPPSNTHFSLDSVQNMVTEAGALAGINGTFFSDTGSPLGALIINGEMVTFPLYDRTALIIDTENRAYIDNVFITSYFKLEDGSRYKISGVNRRRGEKDILLYSPAWGENTGTNTSGLELVMINNEIHALYSGNSPIPPDGYVLSIAGPQLGTIKEKAGLGQKIEAEFKIMTYAVSPGKILHVVAGGPRLLKNGMVYVSKHEENFKADVAKKKAARTAVGITKEKDLLLVTVQGPPNDGENNSRGATLEDLSHLMQALGAVDAMNLDGGSSTAMVVKDRLVSGSRRKVSNAILVFSREF